MNKALLLVLATSVLGSARAASVLPAGIAGSTSYEIVAGTFGLTRSAKRYVPLEIINIPYDTSELSIPTFIELHDSAFMLAGEPPIESKSHILKYTISEDGLIGLVTVGPTPEHRRAFVFGDDGKLKWKASHVAPWVNSVDFDDEGNMLLVVGLGYDLKLDHGVVERRRGRGPGRAGFFSPSPPYVLQITKNGHHNRINLSSFSAEDFRPNQYGSKQTFLEPPFIDRGTVFAPSGKQSRVDGIHRNRGSSNRSSVILDLVADVGEGAVLFGHNPDVRAFWDSPESRARVAKYPIPVAEDEELKTAAILGIDNRQRVHVGAFVARYRSSTSTTPLSWRLQVFAVDRDGRAFNPGSIDDPGDFSSIDWKGRVFSVSLHDGFKVVRWDPPK